VTDLTDPASGPPGATATGSPPSGRGLGGATLGMAVGTTLSRITGVGRIIALTYVLGTLAAADAYNLANTTPNILTDIVIGGVLSATFVPVFVDRLSTRRGDEAWRAISAVTTVTIVVLMVSTVAFWFLVPSIIDLYTATNHNPDHVAQQQVAVSLLRWFVPQLACYGLIGLFTALLNARRKFAAPMFVPIANNLVVIVVLLWFRTLVPHNPTLADLQHQRHALILLGLGTTLGVVVQAALLVPSLLRANLHLSFFWAPAHEAMRTIVRLASWTFGFVVANQIALVVILALADGVRPPGAVSAYTYAYTFFQLPYGVVAVSIMSAVTPSLSARWALRDTTGFRHRLTYGLRAMLAIVIPSAVGMLILARPLIDLVLAHGTNSVADASSTAAALAMFALGLPGFCTFLYMIRVLQSMQDTRTAFYLYLVENVINIVAGVALVGPLGVRGLALSVSIAYTAAAILAVQVIGHRIGGLGGSTLTDPLRRVVGATVVMAVLTVLAVSVSSADRGVALLGRVVLALVTATVAYFGTAAFLGARESRHRPPPRRPGPRDRPPPYRGPPSSRPSPPGPSAVPPPSVAPFRDRLNQTNSTPSVRLLRPVVSQPDDDEGDVHGPDTGSYR
jgi:putative peptidoglycan lipid II flippase